MLWWRKGEGGGSVQEVEAWQQLYHAKAQGTFGAEEGVTTAGSEGVARIGVAVVQTVVHGPRHAPCMACWTCELVHGMTCTFNKSLWNVFVVKQISAFCFYSTDLCCKCGTSK